MDTIPGDAQISVEKTWKLAKFTFTIPVPIGLIFLWIWNPFPKAEPAPKPDPVVWAWTGIEPEEIAGRGVRVKAVGMPAKAASVAPGDLIVRVNGDPAPSLQDAERLLRDSGPKVRLTLQTAAGTMEDSEFPLNRPDSAVAGL